MIVNKCDNRALKSGVLSVLECGLHFHRRSPAALLVCLEAAGEASSHQLLKKILEDGQLVATMEMS